LDNKTLVSTCFDAMWNGGNLAAADTYVAPNVEVHIPPFPDATGRDAVKAFVSTWRSAMPDLSVKTDLLFGEDDRVMQHFALTGTHTGTDLMGVPAKQRSLTVTGVNQYRIQNGAVVEWHGLVDVAGLMRQLQ
jgi:steroid delta-isomerase-like uncharacterized protein